MYYTVSVSGKECLPTASRLLHEEKINLYFRKPRKCQQFATTASLRLSGYEYTHSFTLALDAPGKHGDPVIRPLSR